VIGAALGGAVLQSGRAFAQTAYSVNGAWAQADPVPYWWFHGTIEAGGRFFLNDPQRNGSAYLGQKSLAKFYEYRDLRPGPIGNVWLAAGSRDGLYEVDVGGKNIGYDDQSYYLDASKAGEHYFNFSWDQTPHLYSTSAQTPYLGVGTNALTLDKRVANTGLYPTLNFHQTDIGIRRDTASVQYRWTPTDAWDIQADFSHLRRTGTQVDGLTGFTGTTGGSPFSGATQVPKPVADTTQNYGLNGEYAGTSPWGQKMTFKLGYTGSQYNDDYAAYTVQNPLSPLPAGAFNFAQVSLPPSNQANGFTGTLAADLPWNSRYAGTVSYTMMRQDAAFIPMSYNAAYALPASSLNGAINTLLSNNVLTTKITPELTSKLSYRYYDFHNDTPELYFPSWIRLDGTASDTSHFINSLSMAYTKQNASEELNWRPSREWNLGAAYGYERYDWTRADVNATNEHSGKVFVDWKPATWFTVRSSGYYSDRRYENYDYRGYVGNFEFPAAASTSWRYQSSYRQLMIDNRETWKANFAVDVVAVRGLTLTPTFKYRDENYGVDPANQQGLQDSRSWSGGLDATYVINSNTSVMIGYMREYYTQLLYACSVAGTANGPGCNNNGVQTLTNDKTVVDTVTALLRYAAIPDKLDTELRYTASRGKDRVNLFPVAATGQFPDETTWFQRLDATATYKFDKEQVAQLGWKGDVKAKLHYVWERNSVDNWQNDSVAPYNTWATNALFMAYNNPNYNVHMLMASLAFTW
jgi:MtrB/PioB family decaheme-associated outer membrane protein